jgi:hypothetical protein
MLFKGIYLYLFRESYKIINIAPILKKRGDTIYIKQGVHPFSKRGALYPLWKKSEFFNGRSVVHAVASGLKGQMAWFGGSIQMMMMMMMMMMMQSLWARHEGVWRRSGIAPLFTLMQDETRVMPYAPAALSLGSSFSTQWIGSRLGSRQ